MARETHKDEGDTLFQLGYELGKAAALLRMYAETGRCDQEVGTVRSLGTLSLLLSEAAASDGRSFRGHALRFEKVFELIAKAPGWQWPVERVGDLPAWLRKAGIDVGLAALGQWPSRERVTEIAGFTESFLTAWAKESLEGGDDSPTP